MAAPTMVYFPTWKGKRRLEKLQHYFHEDMACLLEADPDVLNWSAEPAPLELEHDDGDWRQFSYAFRAETADALRLIKLGDDSVRKQKPGKKPWPVETPALKCEYFTRSTLAAHPRLQASRDILFHRPRTWKPELPHQIAAAAALDDPRTLGGIQSRLSADVPFEDLLSLVAQGFICVDLDYAISPDMPVLSCNGQGYLR